MASRSGVGMAQTMVILIERYTKDFQHNLHINFKHGVLLHITYMTSANKFIYDGNTIVKIQCFDSTM
jgi:hypothetical protein